MAVGKMRPQVTWTSPSIDLGKPGKIVIGVAVSFYHEVKVASAHLLVFIAGRGLILSAKDHKDADWQASNEDFLVPLSLPEEKAQRHRWDIDLFVQPLKRANLTSVALMLELTFD